MLVGFGMLDAQVDGRSLSLLFEVDRRRRAGLLGAGVSADSDCLRLIRTSAHAPKAAILGSSGCCGM
ncbi:MAG: hypothetical protein JWP89_7020 [Schlesneria sp.]|nr:hypothetical protein [Schlesneria sp.]